MVTSKSQGGVLVGLVSGVGVQICRYENRGKQEAFSLRKEKEARKELSEKKKRLEDLENFQEGGKLKENWGNSENA